MKSKLIIVKQWITHQEYLDIFKDIMFGTEAKKCLRYFEAKSVIKVKKSFLEFADLEDSSTAFFQNHKKVTVNMLKLYLQDAKDTRFGWIATKEKKRIKMLDQLDEILKKLNQENENDEVLCF